MFTRLTLTSNGCNRGNPAGDHSMSGKAPRVDVTITFRGVENKMRKVKAKLPEPQTRNLKPVVAHGWLTCDLAKEIGHHPRPISRKRTKVDSALQPNLAIHPSSRGYGRTGHLNASHLLFGVNTGSPKRAGFTSPARRRSRHSSRMPGVMPGTAAETRIVMAETRRATGSGMPSDKVKGGAFTEGSAFRTATEGR